MKIALIDTVKKPKFYPVALLKLGAWRRELGDDCSLHNTILPEWADEIWITTVFTFDIPYSMAIIKEAKKRCNRVRVGGIAATLLPDYFSELGVDVHCGLHPEAEKFSPDYSLLGDFPGYSITHTSRGCVRKCSFCMVKDVEPKFYTRPTWENDVFPDSSKIIFYDNNWSAKPLIVMQEDADKIKSLRQSHGVHHIDFNQSMDCRILTPEKINLISTLPFSPIRFAFDSIKESDPLQKVLWQLSEKRRFKVSIDMLYNFEEHPREIYKRMETIITLRDQLNWGSIDLFPMMYRPIKQVASDGHVGRRWTAKTLSAFRQILSLSSMRGTVSVHTEEEFRFWYGKDENEFVALLNYPKLLSLLRSKKGSRRNK